MIREGRIYGLDYFGIYDMTWGEVEEYVSLCDERNRRRGKERAFLAYKQAELIVKCLNGTQVRVEEEFPYWTDKEIAEIKLERIKQALR